ncbi:xanthine dehydrogenase family protein molybdopterin-binding subunit [Nocardia amikacinitolerans]|uniref:xanthine dehydrogenase family protein molybdopterin-binding subunit n=1 Tax=Nocardia amikacinitolerans TaxID=756689 RepID=UPI0020A604B4|nr:xanthine dehydrogenase family protein molybdopterin-binding subunit [Nocardia amikacinitolerans]MCP2281031.1 xanthine dehydrogenase YagR molybdenum-binding subunit [Nocardia amikacinitolerans]MCP2300054.1 xanthine dehydrogenase YagR molybdenum-binding subunit [Nocardia amikacinitolerans]
MNRADGLLKVTGKATYAAEHAIEGIAHAVVIGATVGRGRIAGIDTAQALSEPGVLTVISHLNAPTLPYSGFGSLLNPNGKRLRVFQDDSIVFHGQPVAVLVAETPEAARYAAHLVKVSYDEQTPTTDLNAGSPDEPTAYSRGEADRAFRDSDVQLDATYRTARNHHNPMEPHATIARWDGDRVTVWDKTQFVVGVQMELAGAFGIGMEAVRVITPFVGGAFGSGLRTWPHVVIAALAARVTRRPTKLVLTRQQLYYGTGYRPAYEYRLRLGARRDGTVSAAVHEIKAETATYEQYTENILNPGQMLYATPHVRQAYSTVPLHVNAATWMRGPGYSSAAFAIESAMDELAHELAIDPIELRYRNEPSEDPSNGRRFSTRQLRECVEVGAREFGWDQRNPEPGATRDGDWLIGIGMAAGAYETLTMPAQCSVRLNADGTAVVASSTSEIGPGSYTSMAQVAADRLGLPVDQVRFQLGDSLMPVAPPVSGSQTMASVGSAVHDGCDKLRLQAIALAVTDVNSPLFAVDPTTITVSDGRLQVHNDPGRGESYQDLLARQGRSTLDATGIFVPDMVTPLSKSAYCATFAEVAVDADLGIVRVRRMLGVYDAGRIINPKLADSQALGGMTNGIGAALLEHTVTDHRDGRIVNANLADYLVPVNADVPDLRTVFLDGEDLAADPIGAKGLGEVVVVGVAPAIANAVFNATGRRIRELPITVEQLL